jgi:hypothetical protein
MKVMVMEGKKDVKSRGFNIARLLSQQHHVQGSTNFYWQKAEIGAARKKK